MAIVEQTCERQHNVKVKCFKKDQRCHECFREDEEQERRLKRNLELEKKRLAIQEVYRKELEQIEDEVDFQRRRMQYHKEEEDQKNKVAKSRKDAQQLRTKATNMLETKVKEDKQARVRTETQQKTHRPRSKPCGESEADWQWLKQNDGAESDALDNLMEMIGLEAVKAEFLGVKKKVDTMLKQDASLASERFNCTMLGNPGTGMLSTRLSTPLMCYQEKPQWLASMQIFCVLSA